MSIALKNRTPFALRTAAALALTAWCAGAGAVTFAEAYQAALRNDPTYRMNYYENEYSKENAVIGRAGLLPNVSATYQASRNRVDLTAPDLLGRAKLTQPEYISRSAAVQLRQPLLNLEAVALYRQSKVQAEAGEAQYRTRGGEVVLRVAGAYLGALLSGDALALAQAQRDMYVEQAKVNQRLFEKGEGTRTDMLETQARLDQAEAQVLEAQDALATDRNALAAVIGMDPGVLQPLAPTFHFSPLSPAGFDDWKAIALANNPDLAAARLMVEAGRLEVQKAQARHAPRIDLVATYSKNDAETVNTYNQNSVNRAIGVQMNVPLYAGGQVSAMVRQAVDGYERARADLQARTDKVVIELRKAHSMAVSSVARIAALDKAVASAQLLIKATEQSIKGGVRINLDLLNAQQQLTGVQRDLAQARYGYLVAQLRLRAAAGTLSAADVGEVASYFR
ncbi:TolC family outer membrane protein [Massilia sp. R2A-15]|uniref:TolC family outer membrane protein n=1 Tax=Massilia sp. R2A-15 TaxID=3064278 RepID=UPI00273592A1|nr:TolC family outer membrane protein [Massilia sp. R2A-15]WLI90252.1 TolC family outer membrane protein [Massilia sp. R2A-15]